MLPSFFAPPVAQLIEELAKLPGIGPKSAQRLAMHIIKRPEEEVVALAEALVSGRRKVRYCSVCGNLTDGEVCEICRNQSRVSGVICVVEDSSDVVAMEKTREYDGLYHVLGGLISPMDGVGPDDLHIRELLERLRDDSVREVIIATDPTVEGEATAMYLARLLQPLEVKVTRIARGLPEGGDLDYADEATLSRALHGRYPLT
ncbi:MAG: recombination mediator RecR [Bacillota bacterium]